MRRASIQIFPKCLQTFRNRKSLFHPDRRRHFRLNNFSRRLFMIESDSTGFSFYAFSLLMPRRVSTREHDDETETVYFS